jgi:hypothetical protein
MENNAPRKDALTIALDIDETITAHPQFFAFLSQAAIAAGHTILIITFREDRESTEADLQSWGIAWTTLITSSLAEHMEHGVDEWKGWVCRQHGVDVFFDDMAEVMEHVDESVMCLLVN